MIQAAAYCRVSTDKEDQANSFASQQRYFKEYIDHEPDWELYEVYADEGITGTSTRKRTAFNRMIQDARMGKFCVILTKEVSRFSRNILDTISYTRELKEFGIGVLFLNDGINTLDPDAELRLSIMGSIAQEESRRTSSRVKWGQTRQMEQGVVFGRSLLGYDVANGMLTINPEGAELVRLIFQKYGVEKKGTSVIARELREAGYKTSRGNLRWSGSHIIKILKNEKYVGDLVQKKTFTPDYLTHDKKYNHGEEKLVVLQNHHKPIIDRSLWNLVQSELKKRSRSGPPGGHATRYIFSGKIRCGVCGSRFVSRQSRQKNGLTVHRWGCGRTAAEGRRRLDAQGNEAGCDIGFRLRDDIAREILRQAIASLQMDRERITDRITEIAMEAIQSGNIGTVESAARLEQEIRHTEQKKENALDAFFSGQITQAEMRSMNDKYDGELSILRTRLAQARSNENKVCNSAAFPVNLRRQIAGIMAGETAGDLFYRSLLDSMTVFPNQRVTVQLNHLPMQWSFSLGRAPN